MTISRAHKAGPSGAKGFINVTIGNGATWIDTFRIDVDGAEIAGAGTSDWQLNLRDDAGSVVLSVSESNSRLTVTQSTTYTLFSISCAASALSDLEGDYKIDLIEKTSGGNYIHWLTGVASVRDEPLWSS